MALTGEVIDFKAYKDQATGKNIDLRPTWEIMAELEGIENKFTEGGNAENGNGNI